MVGLYFALFWIQCVAGIAISVYNQILQTADYTFADTMLQIIVGTGPISLGAAANSILIALSAEGIMVLAAWVKKRQFEQGKAIGQAEGRAEGRAQERKRANAKLRALAKEYGIPEEKLQIEDVSEPN